jgi:hypothetical protein
MFRLRDTRSDSRSMYFLSLPPILRTTRLEARSLHLEGPHWSEIQTHYPASPSTASITTQEAWVNRGPSR